MLQRMRKYPDMTCLVEWIVASHNSTNVAHNLHENSDEHSNRPSQEAKGEEAVDDQVREADAEQEQKEAIGSRRRLVFEAGFTNGAVFRRASGTIDRRGRC